MFANKTRNPGFEAAVSAAFPNKAEAKIIVSCSDGRQRAVAALETLEAMGYERLVCCGGGSTCTTDAGRKARRRLPNGTFRANNNAPGDVQGYGHMPEMNNANDAIEFGPWRDETDWKTALSREEAPSDEWRGPEIATRAERRVLSTALVTSSFYQRATISYHIWQTTIRWSSSALALYG